MRDRTGHRLDAALDLPEALPAELSGLAENFDLLLGRVSAIRQRERDFIRHAAHELRTPIAGLQATIELALSQPREGGSYAGYLETCRKSAHDMGELVKRLSALSRIGQEHSALKFEPVDIGALLDDCLAVILPLFEGRGITLKRELPAEPMIATGDVTLLQIIFNNLLDNAVSYTPAGGEIRLLGLVSPSNLEIRIANPAKDLPDNLNRLFEPLFRRESSRNDAGDHLGIGLTLSQEAAAAMGTSLQAQRMDEGRIEFSLQLPRFYS